MPGGYGSFNPSACLTDHAFRLLMTHQQPRSTTSNLACACINNDNNGRRVRIRIRELTIFAANEQRFSSGSPEDLNQPTSTYQGDRVGMLDPEIPAGPQNNKRVVTPVCLVAIACAL